MTLHDTPQAILFLYPGPVSQNFHHLSKKNYQTTPKHSTRVHGNISYLRCNSLLQISKASWSSHNVAVFSLCLGVSKVLRSLLLKSLSLSRDSRQSLSCEPQEKKERKREGGKEGGRERKKKRERKKRKLHSAKTQGSGM